MKNYLLKPSKSKGKFKEEKDKDKENEKEKEKEKERLILMQEKRKSAKSSEKILIKNNKNNDIKNIMPKKNIGKNLIKDSIISPKTIDYSQCK
jgi:hypothetical protein